MNILTNQEPPSQNVSLTCQKEHLSNNGLCLTHWYTTNRFHTKRTLQHSIQWIKRLSHSFIPHQSTTTNQPDTAAFHAVYHKSTKQIDHTTTKPQKHCANLHFEVHVSSVPVVDANVAIFASPQEQGAVAGFGEAVHCLCGHGSFHHLPQAAFQPRVHNVFIHQQIVAHLCTPTVTQVTGLPRRKDCCMQLNTLKLKS